MRLIIKGTVEEAQLAAQRRGVTVSEAHALMNTAGAFVQAVIIVADDSNTRKRVAAWFAEDDGMMPPFPIGSLLYFQEP